LNRIYKTVYPKAASEFLRVSGFEDLLPVEVESVNKELLLLLGEEESVIKDGITKAAENLAKTKGGDVKKLSETLSNLLTKIKNVAEKIQLNTSKMIADEQFLSQSQVAATILTLADDEMAKILNGKVIPGDRVFYPVRAHIAGATPNVHQPDLNGKSVLCTINATDKTDADRAEYLAQHVEKNGGKAVCIISEDTPKELQDSISVSDNFFTSPPLVFAIFSAALVIPALITDSSSPKRRSNSLFTDSTSTGKRSSNPLTRKNSEAAFGYTVL